MLFRLLKSLLIAIGAMAVFLFIANALLGVGLWAWFGRYY
jgi:hypothetical protein